MLSMDFSGVIAYPVTPLHPGGALDLDSLESSIARLARSGVDGIFYAGTVTAPKNIGETLNEADAAAEALTAYLGRV